MTYACSAPERGLSLWDWTVGALHLDRCSVGVYSAGSELFGSLLHVEYQVLIFHVNPRRRRPTVWTIGALYPGLAATQHQHHKFGPTLRGKKSPAPYPTYPRARPP